MKELSLVLALFIFGTSSTAWSQLSDWQMTYSWFGDRTNDSVQAVTYAPQTDRIYAVTGTDMAYSTDRGMHWESANIADQYLRSGTLLLRSLPNGKLLCIERHDGAVVFDPESRFATGLKYDFESAYPGCSITSLAVDPDGRAYLGTVGAGVYRLDSDKWTQVIPPTRAPGVASLAFDEQGRLLVSYDHVYRFSADFTSLEREWPTLAGQVLVRRPGLFYVAADSLYAVTDSGYTARKTPFDRHPLSICQDSTGALAVSISSGTLYISEDSGRTWGECFLGNTTAPCGTSWGFTVGRAREVPVTYDHRIWYSSLGSGGTARVFGRDSLFVHDAYGSTVLSENSIYRIFEPHVTQQVITGDDGQLYFFSSSTDVYRYSGAAREAVLVGVHPPAFSSYAVPYVSPGGDMFVSQANFAGFDRIYRHSPPDTNWITYSFPRTQNGTAIITQQGRDLLASSVDSFFVSHDDGTTWHSFSMGGGFPPVTRGRNGRLYFEASDSSTLVTRLEDTLWVVARLPLVVTAELPNGDVIGYRNSYPNGVERVLLRYHEGEIDTLLSGPEASLAFTAFCDSTGKLYVWAPGPGHADLYEYLGRKERVQTSKTAKAGVMLENRTLRITYPGHAEAVRLFDLLGREVELPLAIGTNTVQLPRAIAHGTYVCQIIGESAMSSVLLCVP